MSNRYFINKIEEEIAGTDPPNISTKQLESIKIAFPKLEEQKEISNILLSLNDEIEEYENKKQKLEKLKKGLMQQLLTGKVRVI